jgi:hypothetical protein
MMRQTLRALGVALLLLTVGLSASYGQGDAKKDEGYYYEEGSLNSWTKEPIFLQKTGYAPEFLKVRFGKHKGFDRVVFEFDSELIGYYIKYGDPPFQGEASDTPVDVRGRAFLSISLYPITATDKSIETAEKRVAEPGKLNMPLIRDVKRIEWFEGELSYVLGLKKKTPYRVQIFSNPYRLVVDFKR